MEMLHNMHCAEYIQQLHTPCVILADKINMESCQLVGEPSAGRYAVSLTNPIKR